MSTKSNKRVAEVILVDEGHLTTKDIVLLPPISIKDSDWPLAYH